MVEQPQLRRYDERVLRMALPLTKRGSVEQCLPTLEAARREDQAVKQKHLPGEGSNLPLLWGFGQVI